MVVLRLALSVPVFGEYQDLFGRPAVQLRVRQTPAQIETVLRFIALVGVPTPIRYLWRPNLRDEADNMFVELAVASNSRYLVTRNIRDFTVNADLNLSHLKIVTPAQFMAEWREMHGREA